MSYREPQEGDCLVCPKCPWSEEVSMEDPDATVSEMWSHLLLHTDFAQDGASLLMAKVKLVDKKGQVIPA